MLEPSEIMCTMSNRIGGGVIGFGCGVRGIDGSGGRVGFRGFGLHCQWDNSMLSFRIQVNAGDMQW